MESHEKRGLHMSWVMVENHGYFWMDLNIAMVPILPFKLFQFAPYFCCMVLGCQCSFDRWKLSSPK